VGILVLAVAGLVAALMTFGVFLPAIGTLGDAARDAGATGSATGGAAAQGGTGPGLLSLPERISACDLDWEREAIGRELTRAEILERTEAEPIVVEVSSNVTCPSGVLDGGDGGGPVPFVYVRRADDAYVQYALVEAEPS